MVLGMSLETFTLVHVLISLVGIASGIVVIYGFLINQRLERWTAIFLVTTGLTSITGFLFPFTAATPAIKLGIISPVVLAIAVVNRLWNSKNPPGFGQLSDNSQKPVFWTLGEQ